MINNEILPEHKRKAMEEIYNLLWDSYKITENTLAPEENRVVFYLLTLYRNGDLNDLNLNHDQIIEHISSNEKSNNHYIRFGYLYILIILKLSIEQIHSFIKLFNSFDRETFEKHFDEIFETLIVIYSFHFDKAINQSILPNTICDTAFNLVQFNNNALVYNPFGGLASFGNNFRDFQYCYQEKDMYTASLAYLRMLANKKIENSQLIVGDSIYDWNPFYYHQAEGLIETTREKTLFDLIISCPPFGLKLPKPLTGLFGAIKNVEHFLIEKGIETLKTDGKLVAIISNRFLSSEGPEQLLRKYLIDNNLLELVVSFPHGLLQNSSIPFTILVINKEKKHTDVVRFIDAGSCVLKMGGGKMGVKKVHDSVAFLKILRSETNTDSQRFVPNEMIISNNCNLSVPRYFLDESEGTPLKSFAEIINYKKTTKHEIGKIVGNNDLKENSVNNKLNLNDIKITAIPKGSYKIKESCILLYCHYSTKTIKTAYFEFDGEPVFLLKDFIRPLKIDTSKAEIDFIINEFYSPKFINQYKAFFTGVYIPVVTDKDLLNIKVNLPSLEIQKSKVYEIKESIILAEKQKINELSQEFGINVADENSFLRHQIAGSLKNARGAFKFIKKILENHVKPEFNNLYELKADERLESTLSSYLDSLERDLNSINKSVNRAGDKIDLMDLNIENFNLAIFIKDYAESLKLRAENFYSINLDLEDTSWSTNKNSDIQISADKELLRKMLDNIIENAEKHAFSYGINYANQNKISFELIYNFKDFTVQLDICNTGKPLPENITYESMIRKGSSSGENSGDGIGMWFVNEAMKIHQGNFGFTDEVKRSDGIPGEYVTSIELTFPIQISL